MRPLRRLGLARDRAFPAEGMGMGGLRRGRPDEIQAAHFDVLPHATDPTLSGWRDPHVVAAPASASASDPRLWLFLGGSFGKPQRQTSIIEHMASLGHWAVNLRYPNDWTVRGMSRRTADTNSHEAFRLQILDGRDRSGLLDLPPQDSILNRLQKLLVWLVKNKPAQGWENFLDGNVPRWDRLAAAGHSQGGGHAALLGKHFSLQRIVMLSAPADHAEDGAPAPWLARSGMTSPDRYFGFSHLRDPGINYILAGWEAIGLGQFGGVVQIERSEPPYGNSHQFVTGVEVEEDRAHASIAVDRALPRFASGRPIFEPVWNQLFQIS